MIIVDGIDIPDDENEPVRIFPDREEKAFGKTPVMGSRTGFGLTCFAWHLSGGQDDGIDRECLLKKVAENEAPLDDFPLSMSAVLEGIHGVGAYHAKIVVKGTGTAIAAAIKHPEGAKAVVIPGIPNEGILSGNETYRIELTLWDVRDSKIAHYRIDEKILAAGENTVTFAEFVQASRQERRKKLKRFLGDRLLTRPACIPLTEDMFRECE